MSTRVIKKYPNRRLYDTVESRYITLSDIRDLVLAQVEFVVMDKKDGSDITRCVLLQIISDSELQGDPVMSLHFLSQIIRSCDAVPSAPLSAHLEESLSSFVNGPGRPGGGRGPSASESAATNISRWKPLQDEPTGKGPSCAEPCAANADPAGREPPAEQKKAS